MCICPSRKKNRLGEFVDYPCGKCFECVRKKKLDWEIRLNAACDWSDCAFFILLSYEDFYYPDDDHNAEYCKRELQLFFKRLRKRCAEMYGKDVRLKYFIASEYGEEKNRLHYHLCLFCKGFTCTWIEMNHIIHDYRLKIRGEYSWVPPLRFKGRRKYYEKQSDYISEPCWYQGFVGNVYNLKMNKKKIKYTVKYIQKQYNFKLYSRFSFKELLPGLYSSLKDFSVDVPIGADIPFDIVDEYIQKLYVPHFGKIAPLPSWWIRLLVPESPQRMLLYSRMKSLKPERRVEYFRLLHQLQVNFENTKL